jgi:hypothetical protein
MGALHEAERRAVAMGPAAARREFVRYCGDGCIN